jgi:hypothetical protein
VTRQQRRRAERDIQKYIAKDGDRCSICHSAFAHNGRSYGGIDATGAAVVVSDCCKSHLVCLLTEGVYSKSDYDFFDRSGPQRQMSSEEISEAFDVYQRRIADADQMACDAQKLAGCSHRRMDAINILDAAWKADDQVWFEQHPHRSHRARAPYPGEMPTTVDVPKDSEFVWLIRQTKPGVRIKAGTALKRKAFPVPDNEAVVHALFDVTANGGDEKELWALIDRYSEVQRMNDAPDGRSAH